MINATYTDILSEIREFFTRHQLVNTFVDGQPYDFQAKENVYSAVILIPSISTIQNSQLQLSLELFFVDRITEDGGNIRNVYNDELQIAQDFVSYFTNRPNRWNLSPENINLEPFEQKFDDILAGWQLSVSVTLPFYRNICEIPFGDIAPVDLPPIADFLLYLVGNVAKIENKSLYYDELQWTYNGADVQNLDGWGNLFQLTYRNAGAYTITLKAKHEGYPDSICTKTITIL